MPRLNQQALKAKALKNLPPGTYSDGNGLTLRVSPTGNRSWVQRLTIAGAQRNMGLGGYPALSLHDARIAAAHNYRAVREGRDPQTERKAAQEAAKSVRRHIEAPTLREVAELVIKRKRTAWRPGTTTEKGWRASLENHALIKLGDRLIYDITQDDLVAVLAPIWTAKARMATVVKQRLDSIFLFAQAKQWRPDNPTIGILEVLPARRGETNHHEAMPHDEIRAFIRPLRDSNGDPATKLSLELAILTASRIGEVLGAEWQEIDREAAVWTIPAERMKMDRPHRVPLARRALAILDEAARLGNATGKGLVFPGRLGCRQGNGNFSRFMDRLGYTARPHGFRSSFKDWSMETDVVWQVSEAALAHRLGNRVQASYARSDLLEKRRPVMDAWAEYCIGSE